MAVAKMVKVGGWNTATAVANYNQISGGEQTPLSNESMQCI
jgi:hypothetical protein